MLWSECIKANGEWALPSIISARTRYFQIQFNFVAPAYTAYLVIRGFNFKCVPVRIFGRMTYIFKQIRNNCNNSYSIKK